ncbi:hypothetical protein I4F81_004776 [Pyropia yezoensis]|uniref:Uncharacterized protein n=1 Tax=Pyropia yezoensis TaxID=2788 RepID=A0ACC3BVZ5_PYRYE|nr:hypothetical protein I4F81_004776 [Neopyropia yezoensis]
MSQPPLPRRRSRLPTPLLPPGPTPWIILGALLIWTALTVTPPTTIPSALAAPRAAVLGAVFGGRPWWAPSPSAGVPPPASASVATSAAALRVVGAAHAVEAAVAAVAAAVAGGGVGEVAAWAVVTGVFGVTSLTRVVRAAWGGGGRRRRGGARTD